MEIIRSVYCGETFEGNYILKKSGDKYFWAYSSCYGEYTKLYLKPDRDLYNSCNSLLSGALIFKEEDLGDHAGDLL